MKYIRWTRASIFLHCNICSTFVSVKNTKQFRHIKYFLFLLKQWEFNVLKYNKSDLEVVLIDKHILFDMICVDNACGPVLIVHR